jgi:hypothetical protein
MDEITPKQSTLMTVLRALAARDATQGASPVVEARLLTEVRRLRRGRTRSLMKFLMFSSGLCAASVMAIWSIPRRVDREVRMTDTERPAVSRAELVTAFFPLGYSTVPLSGERLVRLQVSVDTVRAFGVQMPSPDTDGVSDDVLADVIVGDDGLARAVRFVRPATHDEVKERRR